MRYLAFDEVLRIHERAIVQYGGSWVYGTAGFWNQPLQFRSKQCSAKIFIPILFHKLLFSSFC